MNTGEYGIQFVFGASFDMSANTGLSITFTKPDLSLLTVSNPAVTIANTTISTTEGNFTANTYGLYTFANGDVNQFGPWSARLTYLSTGVKLISDIGTFTVNP